MKSGYGSCYLGSSMSCPVCTAREDSPGVQMLDLVTHPQQGIGWCGGCPLITDDTASAARRSFPCMGSSWQRDAAPQTKRMSIGCLDILRLVPKSKMLIMKL
eukprot:1316732-Amphidinium_carterae.1